MNARRPAFPDHFSAQAADYGRYRPGYPPALFDWLAAEAPARALAVDVGTGNGQAALALAGHFDAVIGCEPSLAQLRAAPPHPRIEYRHETAESLSLPDHAADLLGAAQAAHWFDWPAFCREAARVLKPGGVLAIWSYAYCTVTPEVDRILLDFARDAVGPYWPRERRLVDEGYRGLALPFAPLATPPFAMEAVWDCAAMLGYVGTWSAVARCRARSARDPMALLVPALAAAWGEGRRAVRWPLVVKAARA
ncbi:MAG: class I SAM-dependent methyltransferase [Steroidobacteraceae bacterium]|nr:class I SAM-dependent methyltransferase [Steroidobacteraceae bacterium]